MRNYKENLIKKDTLIKDALLILDALAKDSVLFVVDEEDVLLGTLTDGDIRRFLIKGKGINEMVSKVMNIKPRVLTDDYSDFKKIKDYKNDNLRIIPILNKKNQIIDVLNFNYYKSFLPISVVIMAGGKGKRLLPLTKNKPKPLLEINGIPIIEHNLNRLKSYGIKDFAISLNYLGDQIKNYFDQKSKKEFRFNYICEKTPLGTVGALSKLKNVSNEHILLSNSDILTDLNYEDFYLDFIDKDSDFHILTFPYNYSIPFAVLETDDNSVSYIKEKPTYKHECNAGIYLMKREVIELIPKDSFYDATDLIELLIKLGKRVTTYIHNGYWIDIGRHEDFKRAQNDINNLK